MVETSQAALWDPFPRGEPVTSLKVETVVSPQLPLVEYILEVLCFVSFNREQQYHDLRVVFARKIVFKQIVRKEPIEYQKVGVNVVSFFSLSRMNPVIVSIRVALAERSSRHHPV